jgi:hypothetical protein
MMVEVWIAVFRQHLTCLIGLATTLSKPYRGWYRKKPHNAADCPRIKERAYLVPWLIGEA